MLAPPRSAGRLVLACVASTILVASFVVPIADFSTGAADRLANRAPVTPVLHSIPLAGIDESAVADSAVSMASWDELVGDVHVESLGLAPLPESDASAGEGATQAAAPARAPLWEGGPRILGSLGLVGYEKIIARCKQDAPDSGLGFDSKGLPVSSDPQY